MIKNALAQFGERLSGKSGRTREPQKNAESAAPKPTPKEVELTKKFTDLKKRYDRYAAELIAFRSQAPIFSTLDEVLQARICPCANASTIQFAAYPRVSPTFGTLLLARCVACGCGYSPKIDFDLDDYYTNQYQADVQPHRLRKGLFFSPENPFLETETYARFKRRSQLMLDLGEDATEKSVLDFGCGVGVALRLAKAEKKFAVETDPYSVKILQEEVGAVVVAIDAVPEPVDIVLASHVLEHIDAEGIRPLLQTMRKVVKPDGRFVIAVPDGADQLRRLEGGDRSKVRYEPHLLHFSLVSLRHLMEEAGFEVLGYSTAKSVTDNPDLYGREDYERLEKIQSADLMVVCR
ncbi:MAG: class I SAM-dependent methyltransferase [Pseudomonadota bacterium]